MGFHSYSIILFMNSSCAMMAVMMILFLIVLLLTCCCYITSSKYSFSVFYFYYINCIAQVLNLHCSCKKKHTIFLLFNKTSYLYMKLWQHLIKMQKKSSLNLNLYDNYTVGGNLMKEKCIVVTIKLL